LSKVWAENSGHENEPTEQWKRSQAFLRVFARIFAHEKKLSKQERAELLKNVDDLRPGADLGEFPEEMGTPEEFYRRWKGYEIDVQFVNENRATQRITYLQYPMPPDEWEDLDPAGEPPGHWEGLKFISDPPEKSDS